MFKQTLSFFWEILKVVVLALVIVLPIRYFIFQPFIVKGVSMEPNFHNADYLIVDEITYQFREPQRGEVIVFKSPNNLSEKFIKRIIGLPEEVVEMTLQGIKITDKFGRQMILDETAYLGFDVKVSSKKVALEDDQYYVLGDNRLHSFDSRNWGSLDQEYIIGRVLFRVFPPRAAAYFPVPAY